jgi:hypothetical protein
MMSWLMQTDDAALARRLQEELAGVANDAQLAQKLQREFDQNRIVYVSDIGILIIGRSSTADSPNADTPNTDKQYCGMLNVLSDTKYRLLLLHYPPFQQWRHLYHSAD